jgi:mannitol/fructose-specific phosphotransferase system IIA component (Ntr-type)
MTGLAYRSRVTAPIELIAEPDVVMSGLSARTPEEAIAELHAQLCLTTTAVKNPPQLLAALLERFRLASVGIAADIALPHARTDAVDRMVLGVGRSAYGVAFDALHPQVRLIFLVATPRQQVAEYLYMVAALSRLLKTEGVRGALLAARNEEELRAPLARAMKVKL